MILVREVRVCIHDEVVLPISHAPSDAAVQSCGRPVQLQNFSSWAVALNSCIHVIVLNGIEVKDGVRHVDVCK